jgi:hypothetical protein
LKQIIKDLLTFWQHVTHNLVTFFYYHEDSERSSRGIKRWGEKKRRTGKMEWMNEIGSWIKGKIGEFCTSTGIDKLCEKRSGQGSFFSVNNAPSSKNTSGSDRRKSARYRDGRSIYCIPRQGLPFNAQVLDASVGGLRIRTTELLQPNTVIGVIPNSRGASDQYHVRVMWEAKRNGINQYGLEFRRANADDMNKITRYISPLKLKLQAV